MRGARESTFIYAARDNDNICWPSRRVYKCIGRQTIGRAAYCHPIIGGWYLVRFINGFMEGKCMR